MCVYIDTDTGIDIDMGFPGGSVVKNLPEMQETLVQSLDWEDPLEREMAAHSSILIPWRGKWLPTPVFLAWRIPWTEESGGL